VHRSTLVGGGATAAFATAVALMLAGLGAAPALATPPVGTVAPAPAPPPEAALDGRVKAQADGVRLTLRQGAFVRDFTLTYAPGSGSGSGSGSGWHQHPGLVLATVVSGSVLRSVPCGRPETYGAGQGFVEVGRTSCRTRAACPPSPPSRSWPPAARRGRSSARTCPRPAAARSSRTTADPASSRPSSETASGAVAVL